MTDISWKKLLLYIGFALSVMYGVSPPAGVDVIGWKAFIIFATTLALVISKVYDMGVVSLIALSLLIITNTLSLDEALIKFSYPITWLVVFAFFIAKGFILSGLGTRIALGLSAYVGSTPMRLAYALIGAEMMMAPFIPSNTARGGGLVFPVAQSLGDNIFGVIEDDKKNYRQWQAFLLYSCFQANLISSALFLTAMAGNPIIANLAEDMGFELSWGRWFLGASIPGIAALALTPLMLYFLIRPNTKIAPNLSEHTQIAYRKLGAISSQEKIMAITFIFLLAAWVLGPLLYIHPTAAALFAVTALLTSEVISWKDLATDHHAWTTYVWLTVLFTLTTVMKDHGFVGWAANEMAKTLPVMPTKWLLIALMAVNFYSHYFFASLTSHITTIFHPLLLIGLQMNIPLQPLVFGLAFSTSLSGGLTHYGTGAGTIIYGAGYWTLREWWALGLIHSSMVLAIFIILGFPLWF